jgi:DNA-binding MarR family transcriptional regulator
LYYTTMNKDHKDLLEILKCFAREIRCCSQDETFFGAFTFQQFVIVDIIAQRKEIPMNELHALLAVEKSTTTRLVNPLIRKGFLKRTKSPHDSRAARLELTPEGKEIHKKVWDCLAVFFRGILKNIPVSRKSEVLESAKILIKAIRATMDETGCCCRK